LEFIQVQSLSLNGAVFLVLSALTFGVGSATVFSSAARRAFKSANCCSVVCGVLDEDDEDWIVGVACVAGADCAYVLFPAAAKQTRKANPLAMNDFEL
jgi:hypothetical protein